MLPGASDTHSVDSAATQLAAVCVDLCLLLSATLAISTHEGALLHALCLPEART